MARMMIAFVGAYILGRMKKFKLAIAWFGLMTGYKLKLSPEQLLEQGSRVVEASPQLQQLVAALRGPLLEAVKQAATSAATTQLTGLADQLVHRIEDIGRAPEQQRTTSASAVAAGTPPTRGPGTARPAPPKMAPTPPPPPAAPDARAADRTITTGRASDGAETPHRTGSTPRDLGRPLLLPSSRSSVSCHGHHRRCRVRGSPPRTSSSRGRGPSVRPAGDLRLSARLGEPAGDLDGIVPAFDPICGRDAHRCRPVGRPRFADLRPTRRPRRGGKTAVMSAISALNLFDLAPNDDDKDLLEAVGGRRRPARRDRRRARQAERQHAERRRNSPSGPRARRVALDRGVPGLLDDPDHVDLHPCVKEEPRTTCGGPTTGSTTCGRY